MSGTYGRNGRSNKPGPGRGSHRRQTVPKFARNVGTRTTRELAVVAKCDWETAARFFDEGHSGGVQWRTAVVLARACKRLGVPLPRRVLIAKWGEIDPERLLEGPGAA